MTVTTFPTPFSNTPVTEPALKDVLDQLKRDIFLSMNCHHVGTVQSFNAATQTVTATINYKKTFYQLNATTGVYSPVLVDYPLMVDCPVICLGGGAGALTFPISQGDECLVMFNDRDIDNWFSGGGGAGVATPRAHAFADGIVLVGLRSLGNVLSGYDMTRVVLKNGTTSVGLSATLVKIANNSTTLNTLLQSLVTAIKGLSIDVTGIGPACGVVDPTSLASLTSLASQISGLLE